MKALAVFALVTSLFPTAALAVDVDLDQLRSVVEKYKDVKDSADFGSGAFGYQMKQLKKALETLDSEVSKTEKSS